MWEGPLRPDSVSKMISVAAVYDRRTVFLHARPHLSAVIDRRYSRSTAAAMSSIVTSVTTRAEPIAGVTTKRTS